MTFTLGHPKNIHQGSLLSTLQHVIRPVVPENYHLAHIRVTDSAISAQKSSTSWFSRCKANTWTSDSGSDSSDNTPATQTVNSNYLKGKIHSKSYLKTW